MTLSRRILLKNGLLVLGLLVLAGISLLGLRWLRADVRVALNEYREMETIEQVRGRVASASAALDGAAPDLGRIRQDLADQAGRLRQFSREQAIEEQEDLGGSDDAHDRREAALANSAVASLEQASVAISRGDLAAARAPLRDADAALGSIAAEGNALIHRTQVDSHHDIRVTTDLLAAVAIAITAGAVIVSISQYRSVMAPLGRLRQAVRAMATGDFKTTLPPERDAEFIDLANDFNRMAGELDQFYRRLEDMVAEKSRELVRTERLASVGFLAAGVAHEINNPLNVISGQAELSLKRLTGETINGASTTTPHQSSPAEEAPAVACGSAPPPAPSPDEQVIKKLRIIREEAFRCKEITDKLLSLARQSGRARQRVSLRRVADDVAFMAAAIRDYQGRSLEVRIDPAAEPLDVVADSNEMKQVLLNLTVNALEAVEPGVGRVVIGGRRDGDTVEISVTDNGRGIAPDKLERVFEPFYTDKRGAGSPGTGLGLSITHLIVKQHGGHVTAHSDGSGRGSRFTVRLPWADATDRSAPQTPRAGAPTAAVELIQQEVPT